MDIAELSNISDVSKETIKRNLTSIKGLVNDEPIEFLEGTRYPYNIRKTKLDTAAKKRLTLLEATYRYQYVDEKMLKMSKKSFFAMIDELLNCEYLIKNGTNNPYGANAYDTGIKYEKDRENGFRKNVNLMSGAIGYFVGGVVSQATP